MDARRAAVGPYPSSPAPPHILWPLFPLLEWTVQRRKERRAKRGGREAEIDQARCWGRITGEGQIYTYGFSAVWSSKALYGYWLSNVFKSQTRPCGDPRKYKRDWILSCPSGWRRESCSTSRYCIVRQSRNSGGEGSRYPVMGGEVRVLARHPFIQLVPTTPQAHFSYF